MRLRYQSFGNLDSTPGYQQSLTTLVKSVVSEGTEVVVAGLKNAHLAGKQYRPFQELDTVELMASILSAAEEFDALVIGNTMDPGLVAARQLLTAPVVGLFQTSLAVGGLLARGMWVICSNEVMIPRIEELVRVYAQEAHVRCISALPRGQDVPKMAEAFDDARTGRAIGAQFYDYARASMPERTELIVPASGILQLILHTFGIRDVEGVPVLNGIAASASMAEMLSHLRETVGLTMSRRLTYAYPGDTLTRTARELYSKWESSV